MKDNGGRRACAPTGFAIKNCTSSDQKVELLLLFANSWHLVLRSLPKFRYNIEVVGTFKVAEDQATLL